MLVVVGMEAEALLTMSGTDDMEFQLTVLLVY